MGVPVVGGFRVAVGEQGEINNVLCPKQVQAQNQQIQHYFGYSQNKTRLEADGEVRVCVTGGHPSCVVG